MAQKRFRFVDAKEEASSMGRGWRPYRASTLRVCSFCGGEWKTDSAVFYSTTCPSSQAGFIEAKLRIEGNLNPAGLAKI
jgi:hypothetical protein